MTEYDYTFTLEDGTKIEASESDILEYQGETYTAQELWELINGEKEDD